MDYGLNIKKVVVGSLFVHSLPYKYTGLIVSISSLFFVDRSLYAMLPSFTNAPELCIQDSYTGC